MNVYVFIVDIQDILTELEYEAQDLLIPTEAAAGRWVGYPWASQIELDACNYTNDSCPVDIYVGKYERKVKEFQDTALLLIHPRLSV